MATLSEDQLRQYAEIAGFSGRSLDMITSIARRESGLNTDAYNGNESTGDNSVGLTQINMIGTLGQSRLNQINQLFGTDLQSVAEAKEWLKNPLNNLRYAFYISGSGSNFSPWTTANSAAADVTGGTGVTPNNGRALTSAGVSLLPNNAGVQLDMPDGTTQQYDPSELTDAIIQQMYADLYGLTVSSPEVVKYASDTKIPVSQALSAVRLASLTSLQGLEQSAQQLRLYKQGMVADPTGKYIILVNSLDPQARAQADAINQQVWTDVQNKYLSDQYGLNADRITSLFNSKISGINQSLGYDQNALSRANSLISRQLQGQQESRARAQFVTDTLTKLAPWATGGKTEFTGNDFGAIGAEYAKMAGMDPNAVALRFPGSMTVTPQSLLAMYDQQAGVGGQLPGIPEMETTPSLLRTVQGGMEDPGRVTLLNPGAGGPIQSLVSQLGAAAGQSSGPWSFMDFQSQNVPYVDYLPGTPTQPKSFLDFLGGQH